MKTCICSLLLMLMVTGVIPASAQPCTNPANIYSFTYNGKTYEVVKEMKNWVNAAACAVERGGYLIEIGDQGEQAAVYDAIINGAGVSPNYTVVPDGGGIAYVWIGATDKEIEGTWLWDGDNSGTGVNFWNGQGVAGGGGGSAVGGAYINWGGMSTGVPNEPDNFGSGQDAAAIALAGWPSGTTLLGIAGEWNDISLSNAIYFVIEIDNTGMNEQDQTPVRIYPNPANGQFTVQTNGSNQLIREIRMFNRLGVTVLETSDIEATKVILKTNSLPSGCYMVSVLTGTNQVTILKVSLTME
ncbi:MAG: T9SS type A sorting domain-containing protein [bacterium]